MSIGNCKIITIQYTEIPILQLLLLLLLILTLFSSFTVKRFTFHVFASHRPDDY